MFRKYDNVLFVLILLMVLQEINVVVILVDFNVEVFTTLFEFEFFF